MATIKSYTDIEQSRKLEEILPIETADMYWCEAEGNIYVGKCPDNNGIPAWSVPALLEYLAENHYTEIQYCDGWGLDCRIRAVYDESLLDACYKMIIMLNEQNLL